MIELWALPGKCAQAYHLSHTPSSGHAPRGGAGPSTGPRTDKHGSAPHLLSPPERQLVGVSLAEALIGGLWASGEGLSASRGPQRVLAPARLTELGTSRCVRDPRKP
jgi:hypothetical protein